MWLLLYVDRSAMASILEREAADIIFDSNHILFCGKQCIIELHMVA
jgi:hypothetical protein